MTSTTPRSSPHLPLLLWIILSFCVPSLTQQIGSFFTAIYLNGAPVASYQSSCSNMGQGQYCCGAGQSCAWDDAGHVACCASGSNCQGSPYSSGAAAGAYNYQSSWQPPSSSYYQVTPITTTVFTQGQTDCNCQPTPNNVVPVVPVVPVSKATMTTSYYAVPTSTYYASSAPTGTTTTTTVPAQGQGQVTTVVAAGGGQGISTKGPVACATVSTVTEANVGQPVRTVGCLIIVNEGSKGRDLKDVTTLMLVSTFGLVGALLY